MHCSNNTLTIHDNYNSYRSEYYETYHPENSNLFNSNKYHLYKSQTIFHFVFTNISCITIIYFIDYLLKKCTANQDGLLCMR